MLVKRILTPFLMPDASGLCLENREVQLALQLLKLLREVRGCLIGIDGLLIDSELFMTAAHGFASMNGWIDMSFSTVTVCRSPSRSVA